MSGHAIGGDAGELLAGSLRGFHGKIPARGDFVRAGLPGSFVAAWDGWLQEVLPFSRVELGDSWLPAWLEAPIWYFALPPGLCGPDAVLGVWMPSVDRAGRHFPLTLAAVAAGASAATLVLRDSGAWLGRAERAGLDALEYDTPPDALALQLQTSAEPGAVPLPDAVSLHALATDPDASLWWTQGAPRVPAATILRHGLPNGPAFIAMLQAGNPGCPGESP